MGESSGHPFRGNQWTGGVGGGGGAAERMKASITKHDNKLYAREAARGRGNPHRLALMLEAADRVVEDIGKGMTPEKAYMENFVPTRETHATARDLGLNLDVQKGRWVPKEQQAQEAAVARAEFHAKTGMLDFSAEETKAAGMTDAELHHARQDAFKAAEAMGRDNPRQGFYMDQVSVYAKEQQTRNAAKVAGPTMSKGDYGRNAVPGKAAALKAEEKARERRGEFLSPKLREKMGRRRGGY